MKTGTQGMHHAVHRLTPAMRVRARWLARGVLLLSGTMLLGSVVFGVALLRYGAPLGQALVELGLRLQSAGTPPVYLVSIAPGLERDSEVREVVRTMAIDAVTEEAVALGLRGRR